MAKPATTEALNSIKHKRKALESLINIACSVENQQAALSELSLAAKPSQEFPKKVVDYFKAIEERSKETDSTALLQKMDKVEEAISRSVEKILLLAKVDVNKLRDAELANLDIETFQNFIGDFKRRTNTSLALRYILKKRGMAIAPIKLPIQQETISVQIEALKEKEKRCVKQIRSEIQKIIKDTKTALSIPDLPEAIKTELSNVEKAMQVNITHLDQGGSASTIPNVFETIVLESSSPIDHEDESKNENESEFDGEQSQSNQPATAPSKNQETEPKPPKIKAGANEIKHTPKSNWWIFKKWLSSPWATSWRSLKKKYGKPN